MKRSRCRFFGLFVVSTFAVVTLAVHAVLAVVIALHARMTGRDHGGRWALATLLGGVFVVARYVRTHLFLRRGSSLAAGIFFTGDSRVAREEARRQSRLAILEK